MTNYEKETVINYNEAEKEASVYTANKKLMARLEMLSKKFPEQFKFSRKFSDGAKEYIIPKKYVAIKAPLPKRKISDEEREKMRERMLLLRQKNQESQS